MNRRIHNGIGWPEKPFAVSEYKLHRPHSISVQKRLRPHPSYRTGSRRIPRRACPSPWLQLSSCVRILDSRCPAKIYGTYVTMVNALSSMLIRLTPYICCNCLFHLQCRSLHSFRLLSALRHGSTNMRRQSLCTSDYKGGRINEQSITNFYDHLHEGDEKHGKPAMLKS